MSKITSQQYAIISGYIRTEWESKNPKLITIKEHIVKDFYKPELVEPNLKKLKAGDENLYKEQYNEVVGLLKKKPELLLKSLNELIQADGLYIEQVDYKAPKKSLEQLAKNHTTYDDKKDIYKIKNTGELRQELESDTVYMTTGYNLELPDNAPKETIFIKGLPLETNAKGKIASELTNKLDLENNLETDDKPIDEHRLLGVFRLKDLVSTILRDVLVAMINPSKADKYPNIRGDMVAIAKPIIDASEQFYRIKENPELMQTLEREYRTEQEQKDSGGLGIAVQSQLFNSILDPQGELGGWANVDEVIRTFNIAGTTALITCIRYLHENPQGGDLKLTDLMTYNAKYKEQKEARRGLAKTDRISFSNSLKMLLGTTWAIKTKEGKKSKTYTQKYYQLIKADTEHDSKTGDIVAVKGLKYADDFYEIKDNLFYVIAPKGLDYLPSPEAKQVALRVQSRFAKEQKNTIEGKPIKVTREWLVKGSYKLDKNTNTIVVKVLNDMVENNLIAKWTNIKGTQVLNGYDKDTYKLLLYPTQEAQQSYISKEQRQAEKQADKARDKMLLQQLKKAVKSNTRDDIASHLNIEAKELDYMLAGSLKIPENLHNKIESI